MGWPYLDEYTMSDFMMVEKMQEEAASIKEHQEHCPRATMYDTPAFYNFNHKRKKRKKG